MEARSYYVLLAEVVALAVIQLHRHEARGDDNADLVRRAADILTGYSYFIPYF